MRNDPYIENCLETPPEKRSDVWCVVQRLVKAWQDPKYDVDILLCFTHLIWALGVWLWAMFPGFFTSYTAETAMTHGNPILWAEVALALGLGHYFSIFLRRPILRIPFFLFSMVWGLVVSVLIHTELGPNLASMIYMVVFIYMPSRKIGGILRTSIQDYKEERFMDRNVPDEDNSGHRGEAP